MVVLKRSWVEIFFLRQLWENSISSMEIDIYFNTKVKKFRVLKKLDAYLRSPGLSVGNKLCVLCLHLPKFFFFMQLLVYPVIVFFLGMLEM